MEKGFVRKVKVPAYKLGCCRCGHTWTKMITREEPDPPERCARCKSPNYLVPKGELALGRPPEAKKKAG